MIPEEYVEAWIHNERGETYPLGPVLEGLGYVAEENLQRMAENQDRIIFLIWVRREK